MSAQQGTPNKEEEMQSRPESPPLGLLDPSRLQNPLADQQQQQQQQLQHAPPPQQQQLQQQPQQQQNMMPMQQPNPDAFVIPEPRSQPPPQQQHSWQRTPTMSPATSFGNPSGFESVGTPGSQRSSTGTPTHLMAGGQQQHSQQQMHPQFVHESPTHPMTPGSGHHPGSAAGTPGSAAPQQQNQFDFNQTQQQAQMQAQAQQQAQMQAQAQQQAQMQAQAQHMQQQQQQQQQQQNQMQYPGQIMQQQQQQAAAESPNMFRPMQHMPQQMAMHQHHPSHPQFAQHQQYPPHPQWQQQMYARQVVPQRQPMHAVPQQQHPQQQPQRVPVPYPPGAYPVPNAGQMTPGSMPPGYPIPPQGPSPAMRTAPNSGGSVQQQPTPQQQTPQPQQIPQRPQYPQGTAAVPPPYAYPPGQVTPTGQQFPPGSFPSPAAHQMYRAQAPQGMRQYISPQAGQQPSAPHNRFTQPQQATPSPHFAAQVVRPNLVSPAIMSPGHQQLPNTHQRVLMNDHPQAVRQLPGQFPPQHLPPYGYRPHEHTIIPNVNTDPELFFTGCTFHIFEAEKLLPADRLDVVDLMFMIKFHGGEIDFTPKTYPEKKNYITHVIINTCNSQHATAPLQDGKRLVTLQWLVDVIQKQKVEVPWKLAHIPGPFNENFRPYAGKVYSLGGFDENERPAIQFMAEAMGAKISPFLARFNDLLIAKTHCPKVEKAREWGVKVVNYQWLADAYVLINQNSQERPLPENPRYQLGQQASDICQSPSIMEVMSPSIKQILHAWKQHVIITDEHCARAKENREKLLLDLAQFPNKQLMKQDEAPSDEEIAAAQAERDEKQKKYEENMKIAVEKGDKEEIEELEKTAPLKIVVTFGNGFSDEVLETMKKKLLFLGGKLCDEVKDCTHLILINGRRSLKLLEGICFGKNIMSPEWIIDGYKRRTFMDTLDYFMRDEDVEKELGYSCKRSVLRARHMQIFEDVEFYITPSVQPDFETTSKLVKLAGGTVLDKKPTPQYIAKCIEVDQAVIIISCDVDVKTVVYLAECGFPIYNADLVLMSILRQNVEFDRAFMVPAISRTPQLRQPVQFSNTAVRPSVAS